MELNNSGKKQHCGRIILAVTCVAAMLVVGLFPVRSFAQTLTWTSPTEYSQFQIGGATGVGVAAWTANNDRMYVAETSNSGNGAILTEWTADGSTWSNASQITVESPFTVNSAHDPALAVFNGLLYAAWVDSDGIATIASSSNGVNFTNFSTECAPGGVTTAHSPALVVFNGTLYMGLVSSSNTLSICKITSPTQATLTTYPSISIGIAPGMAVFNNTLYVAYTDTTGSNYIYLAESTNGTSFTVSTAATSSHSSTQCIPVVFNGVLYIGFRENDTGNRFYYNYSTNGTTFSGPIEVHWTMGGGPALVVPTFANSSLSGHLFNVFKQNASSNYLFTANAPVP